MTITSLLHYADWDQFQLPQFARRNAWPHDKVISLFNSLYRGYPLGGFILHEPLTVAADEATHRKTIVDGVERVAAIYGVLRGRMPLFLANADRSAWQFCFDLNQEQFVARDGAMMGNPRYIALVEFFASRSPEVGKAITALYPCPPDDIVFAEYLRRIARLARIVDRSLYIEYMPTDASIDDCQAVRDIANGKSDGE